MRRTITPALTAAALLILTGCAQQTSSEAPAETTQAAAPTTEPADDSTSGGECGTGHQATTIDLNDEQYWGEEATPPTACFGDTVILTNGLTVTAEIPHTEKLGDDGQVIMGDEEIPGAEVLAIDITLKNGTGSVLDTEGWDAPVGPASHLIWSNNGETYEGQRVGNLNSADPGKAFPTRILPDTTATESRLFQMPGPTSENILVFMLSTASLANSEDYDPAGADTMWQGPVPEGITLAETNPENNG